jgi:hypothetical protein
MQLFNLMQCLLLDHLPFLHYVYQLLQAATTLQMIELCPLTHQLTLLYRPKTI